MAFLPIALQAASANTFGIAQQLEYGIPIMVLIIGIAAFIMWRKSPKNKKNAVGIGEGNMALIMSPDRNFVVDIKPFTIHRETDPKKNVLATYALFPDEEKGAGNGGIIATLKARIGGIFGGGQQHQFEEEEKKGRVFDETLAAIKKNGGWLTAYTLETNTQIPLLSKFAEKDQIAIMERNIEKRMSILKSVQIAAQQYETANAAYDNLGGSIKVGAFAILIAILILAIVLTSIPGSVQTSVQQALGTLHTGAAVAASNLTHP